MSRSMLARLLQAVRLAGGGGIKAASRLLSRVLRGGRLCWRKIRFPLSRDRADRRPAAREARRRGRFIAGEFSNEAGRRAYKLYVPGGYRGQSLPLVVMLHGCGQDPDDFAAGTGMNRLAEERLCLVLYPAQTQTANFNRCWNWHRPREQQRDGGEPSLIAGMTRKIAASHHADTRRIYVAGLSSGGAMAAILGITYPDLYAAVGVHSGLAHGAADNIFSAFGAMRRGARRRRRRDAGGRSVPTIVFHGDRDTTVHPRNGDLVIAQSAAPDSEHDARIRSERGRAPGGHAYTRDVYHDARGKPLMEQWLVHGEGHAWSGGSPEGNYTDPRGPDASREMLRFFEQHTRAAPAALDDENAEAARQNEWDDQAAVGRQRDAE